MHNVHKSTCYTPQLFAIICPFATVFVRVALKCSSIGRRPSESNFLHNVHRHPHRVQPTTFTPSFICAHTHTAIHPGKCLFAADSVHPGRVSDPPADIHMDLLSHPDKPPLQISSSLDTFDVQTSQTDPHLWLGFLNSTR